MRPDNTLPKFIKGEYYSDAFKSLDKSFEGRHDKYSMNTKSALMERLAMSQLAANEKYAKPDVNQAANGTGPETFDVYNDNLNSGAFGYDAFKEAQMIDDLNNTDAYGLGIPNISDPTLAPVKTGIDWGSEKASNAIGLASAGVGVLAQTAGLISTGIFKHKLEDAGYDTVAAHTVSKGNLNPYLVNRQNIEREISAANSTGYRVASETSGGNLGLYASQASGVHSAGLKALSSAMLGAEIADASEKARVQQLGLSVDQFNATQLAAADEATAQNKGAYDSQIAAYNMGIAANAGSLGQSLLNYHIATKSGGYLKSSAELEALAERGGSRRRNNENYG